MSKNQKKGVSESPVKVAKLIYQKFLSDNNISDIKSLTGKLKTQHSKLLSNIEALENAAKGAKTKAKGKSAKKGGAGTTGTRAFQSKYEYPADITTPAEKKRYRVEQRRLANKAEKQKAAKAEKKAAKADAAVAPVAKKKKVKNLD